VKITVYFDAKAVKPTVVQNATVVLVDVLRATTTIPVFLYHGASGVALCHDPGAAKKQFEKLKRGEGFLAGERDWEKIPGFHLGGSPLESSREKIKDRLVCFSTQTPLRVPSGAKYVILGSFVNLNDVYDSCLRGNRDVVIVCAGNPEDSAFAGMLVDFLQSTLGSTPIVLAESAKDAIALYKPWQGRIVDLLRESPDGKELIKKGYAKDLDYASKVNRLSSVPYLKDQLFLKEDTPKPKKALDSDGKPRPSSAPQKGKSIKVTVPLFPKNPEHPVPGMEKAAAKKGAPVEDKKADGKKKEMAAGKKADGKTAGSAAKPAGKPKKAAGKPAPMFSKKTIASPVFSVPPVPVAVKSAGKKK
jgi:2-phosphosulfolactate phosphatase